MGSWGLGFRVRALGFRKLRVSCLGCRVSGLWSGIESLGLRTLRL